MRRIQKIKMITGVMILTAAVWLWENPVQAQQPETNESLETVSECREISGNEEAAPCGPVSGAGEGAGNENAASGGQAFDAGESSGDSIQAQAASQGLQFDLEGEDAAAVTGYTGNGPHVSIPDEIWGRPVTTIRQGAFTDDTKIQSLDIGKNVTVIEKYSCNRMESLRNLSIPANVTKIGMSAFASSKGLTSLVIQPGDTQLTLVCGSFVDCGSLSSIDLGTRPIKGVSRDGNAGGGGNLFSGTAITELVIPATADFTEMFSFCENCEYLQKVSLTAKSIKPYSFSRCPALEDVVLYGTETIGNGAFARCGALKHVSFPEGLKTLEWGVFEACTALESAALPASLETIEASAFSGCASLQNIQLPEGLTSLGGKCFQGCTALSSIHIPAGVSQMGSMFLDGCTNLEEITVDEENPSASARGNILYDKEVTTVLRAAYRLESLELPDTVSAIGEYSCTEMPLLTQVAIPGSVAEIREEAFQGSGALGRLEFAQGDTPLRIHRYAFDQCAGLSEIQFGGRQMVLDGDRIFRGCALEEVEIPASLQTQGATRSFEKCSRLKRAEITGDIIGNHLFGNCTSLKTAVLNGMTEVPDSLFSGCTALEDVVLPQGVQTIGAGAFLEAGIQEIQLPQSLQVIRSRAFAGSGLRQIAVPSGVEELSLTSFEGCKELESITVDAENPCYAARENMLFDKEEETLLYLPRDGYALENVTIPAGVKRIGTRTLSNLGGVQWIAFDGDIPAGVYESYDAPPLSEGRFSGLNISTDARFFYDEGYPAWADTSVISVPALLRIPITGEMRELKILVDELDAEQITADDKESCTSLRERYAKMDQDQRLFIGGEDQVEHTYQRGLK